MVVQIGTDLSVADRVRVQRVVGAANAEADQLRDHDAGADPAAGWCRPAVRRNTPAPRDEPYARLGESRTSVCELGVVVLRRHRRPVVVRVLDRRKVGVGSAVISRWG